MIREAGNFEDAELSTDELVSAMLLAKKWEMEGPQKIAITTLATRTSLGITQKAALGIRYHVEEWAVPSLNALAKRKSTHNGRSAAANCFLREEEGDILGVKAILLLVSVREHHNRYRYTSPYHTDYVDEEDYDTVDYTSTIKSVFQFEN